MMVPGKLGLLETKVKVLVGSTLVAGFFGATGSVDRDLAAADHEHVRRHGHVDGRSEAVQAESADREPASGIEQVAGVVADVGQLQARNRAVVAGFERAFVFEGQRGRGVFGQACGQRNADGRILGDALGGERLALFVENFGDAQVVMQFEDGDA